MKSILVGNGINIQFGNKAYTNNFIMKRIKYRAKLDSYNKLFNNTLTKTEILKTLDSFVEISNEILTNRYDKYVNDDETLFALNDFKSRYEKINASHEIMLEDWFFILHMFFLKNSDISDNIIASKQGFERLILDAIYNSGSIQDVYLKMNNRKVKNFFAGFDSIFSLNYDNNIEKLTGKNVYHLHGDFSILADSENANNVLGFIREGRKERVVIENMEHCFCNAMLNYSGRLKLKEAEYNHNLILESEKYEYLYENDEEFKSNLLCMKVEKPDWYEMIVTKINHPNLNMATEYHFNEFKNIQDELYILGMSPNNDDHIFDCINRNDKLKKIYFYYYSDIEKKFIEDNLPKGLYECRSVTELWKELECSTKKFNCNHNIPDNIGKFIDCFNALSGDTVSKEQIIKEINSTPQFEADRLCKLVAEDMKKRNPNNESTNFEDFEKQGASISYIALREGIVPSALYMIYTMNSRKIKE